MKYHKYAYYAYAAGLIDADGTIGIYRNNKNQKTGGGCILKVSIQQADRRAIDFLAGFFGGRAMQRKDEDAWCWYRYGPKALELLKKIEPFLRIKRDQARLAIRFELYRQRAERYTLCSGSPIGNFSDEARIKLMWFHDQMRELKQPQRPSLYHPQRLSETTLEYERSDSLTLSE